MFVRKKSVKHGAVVYEYLQIVETQRIDGRPRQRVVASLGRLDEMIASGSLDRLIRGMIAHSRTLQLSESGSPDEADCSPDESD